MDDSSNTRFWSNSQAVPSKLYASCINESTRKDRDTGGFFSGMNLFSYLAPPP